MFYSIFHQPTPNFTLREDKKMKIIGYFVKIGKRFETVSPSSNPVIKHGKKQFWFFHNHTSMLAVQRNDGVWTVMHKS
jgi:hypothetical protein